METAAPVIVGIDGSTASVRAALWAADEATARDTTLHLLCVVDPKRVEDLDDALTAAHHAIHRAWETIVDSGKHVKLESEILQGNPVLELADAARRCALLCVGHKGAKDSAPMPRGSTANTLARIAPSSVAVVRRQHTHRALALHRWIVAVLDESAASHAVLQTALDEAALREAPVLALTTWSTTHVLETGATSDVRSSMDRYLNDSHDDPADLQVCALPLPDDLATMLEQSASVEQLFVVGSNRHDLVDQLTDDRARKALRGTNCSILVVHADPSGADAPVEEDSSDFW
jgi:nucleotide-binding universal stress UspA family protein